MHVCCTRRRGKEERKPHAPRVQHTATGHSICICHRICFRFYFFLAFPIAFRLAFLLNRWILELCLNIGFIIKYNSHYHRGLLFPFLFAASSFCCFRCCNCITRLKARTFWVNSHSQSHSHSTHTDTDTGTSTYTVTVRYFLSWGFLFVAAKTSKQNKRRQPKKCIKKTKTEEIQKKTLDSSTQHTTNTY